MLTKLLAFLNGAREFRSDMTANYQDFGVMLAYDWGREWAHRLTFRHFEG